MIILTCDHAGLEYKNKIKNYLTKLNYQILDMGPTKYDSDDDYPDFVHPACKKLGDKDIGIFVCGSGIGVNIVANRYQHIRAVNAVKTEMARLARKDEDANVLCLGARLISYRTALSIIKIFLKSRFEGGRHIRRISKFETK